MQHTLERRCIFVFGDRTGDSECADAAFFRDDRILNSHRKESSFV